MKITRINGPKFKVGRYTLNEYELRNLMVEVATGIKSGNIKVKDCVGNTAIINGKGFLEYPDNNCIPLKGLNLMGDLTSDLVRTTWK